MRGVEIISVSKGVESVPTFYDFAFSNSSLLHVRLESPKSFYRVTQKRIPFCCVATCNNLISLLRLLQRIY